MANRRLEAVYVTRPVSIAYLTGFHADPHERLMALAVRPDGATLIVPALERQSAAEHASNAAVVAWRDGEDPYELVDRALAGLTEVGVEKDHLSLLSAELITSRTGVSELVDVGTEIVRLRLVKHEAEIEKLARAAAITDAACDAAFSRLRAGQSEIEIALMLGTLMLPYHVTLIPQYILFLKLGWVKTMLPLVVPKFLAVDAFFIFLMVQFFRGIPRELDEAAMMDGCSPWRIYWRIMLPLSLPVLATAAIFSFIWSWSDFFGPLVFLNDVKSYTVQLGLRSFVDATSVSDWAGLFAMSSLALLPVFFIFLFFQRMLIEGIATTGMKR